MGKNKCVGKEEISKDEKMLRVKLKVGNWKKV
jgi:hypothetical protein